MNAIQFAQDLKLGHYMKIGQRYTFIVQMCASLPPPACHPQAHVLTWLSSPSPPF